MRPLLGATMATSRSMNPRREQVPLFGPTCGDRGPARGSHYGFRATRQMAHRDRKELRNTKAVSDWWMLCGRAHPARIAYNARPLVATAAERGAQSPADPPLIRTPAPVRDGLARLLPRLWRFCLVLTGNRSAADDLAQAACLRALEREDQFEV